MKIKRLSKVHFIKYKGRDRGVWSPQNDINHSRSKGFNCVLSSQAFSGRRPPGHRGGEGAETHTALRAADVAPRFTPTPPQPRCPIFVCAIDRGSTSIPLDGGCGEESCFIDLGFRAQMWVSLPHLHTACSVQSAFTKEPQRQTAPCWALLPVWACKVFNNDLLWD